MDEVTHKTWWPLHYRKAYGEPLTPEEEAVYMAGVKQLDEEERLDRGEEKITQLQARIAEAMNEQQKLRARQAELEARVALLEARKNEKMPAALGIGH